MITYTKTNVRVLTLLVTVLIFTIFHLCIKIPNLFLSAKVYSKSIPIYLESTKIATHLNTTGSGYLFLEKISQKENEKKLKQTDFIKIVFPSITSQKMKQLSRLGNQFYEKNSNLELEENRESIQNKEGKEQSLVQLEQQSQEQMQAKSQKQVLKENKANSWRIQIPKINLDVHIKEGTTSAVMLEAVGHFEETSKWNGNVGLAAHNRGYQCNFFQEIKNLKIGDEIIYLTKNGKKIYQVQINKIILETDWSYLQKTKDNRITLITCEENRKEYRRCVQAVEIASYKSN